MGLILSDLHIGHEHSLEETGGLSAYSLDIFKERLKNLQYAVADIYELHSNLYKIPALHVFSLGDIVDGMNEAGAWSPVYISTTIYDQVMIGYQEITRCLCYWLSFFEEVHFYGIRGNHGRCKTKNTRILTPNGYKYYYELKQGDMVGTLNCDTNTFEFQPIEQIHIYENEKTVVGIDRKKLQMLCSLDHDVLVKTENKKNMYRKVKAKHLKRNTKAGISIPISISSNNTEYDIDDNVISLLGWIMTDGCYDEKTNAIRIYQSKNKTQNIIRKILQDLNVEFSEKTNETKRTNSILGTKIKNQLKQHYFYLNSSDFTKKIKDLLPERKDVPSWMHNLSDRQVSVLLHSLMLGDGSFRENKLHKDGYVRKGGYDSLWGGKKYLEKLAGLFVSHNIPCSVIKHKRLISKIKSNNEEQESWYLQIKKNNKYRVVCKDVIEKEYNDTVWCVTVSNGTIAVLSESGHPYFTGNCARSGSEKDYNNWDNVIYELLKLQFKDNKRIHFHIPKTWWMLEKIRNHKFLMVHGDDVKSKNPPVRSLLDFEQKMSGIIKDIPNYTIAGHFHNASEYTTHNGRCLVNGSFLGGDMYSLRNYLPGAKPEQKLFGIHDKRGITYMYNIDLDQKREDKLFNKGQK
jgi:hypothetical protein